METVKNLNEFISEIKSINNQINNIGIPLANGPNTLSSQISTLKNIIEYKHFALTKFSKVISPIKTEEIDLDYLDELKQEYSLFLKNLPQLNQSLNVDFFNKFQNIFEQDDFYTQWNQLNNDDKKTVINLDKNTYKLLRTKLDLNDFNFIFEFIQILDIVYPESISNWIHTNSKSQLFLLRKNSKNTLYEDFFNDSITKEFENSDIENKTKIANNYLIKKKNEMENESWYNKLDSFYNKHIAFSSIYSYFWNLENEFNGYSSIIEKIKLPDILKTWCGTNSDKNEQPYSQNSLSDTDFKNLQLQSKNTEFEDFFNHEMTNKMSSSMPYQRINYMFLYFKDKFTKENMKKNKP